MTRSEEERVVEGTDRTSGGLSGAVWAPNCGLAASTGAGGDFPGKVESFSRTADGFSGVVERANRTVERSSRAIRRPNPSG